VLSQPKFKISKKNSNIKTLHFSNGGIKNGAEFVVSFRHTEQKKQKLKKARQYGILFFIGRCF